MKHFFISILFLTTVFVLGQEPIYNINNYNLHLLNYAEFIRSDYSISSDNGFNYYTTDKILFYSNLNFDYELKEEIKIGVNVKFDYLNTDNFNTGFDGIFKYKINFNGRIKLDLSSNIGVLSSKVGIETINAIAKKNSLNIGLSSILHYSSHSIGFSIDHLNKPKLPFNNGEMPIKYTAFLRNRFGQFSSLLIYNQQDDFLFNPADLKYYYEMFNYLGINANYQIIYPFINLGLGIKHLSNNNNIYSINTNFVLGHSGKRLVVNYSFSIMPESKNKIAQFHQISLYTSIYPMGKYRRLGGLL